MGGPPGAERTILFSGGRGVCIKTTSKLFGQEICHRIKRELSTDFFSWLCFSFGPYFLFSYDPESADSLLLPGAGKDPDNTVRIRPAVPSLAWCSSKEWRVMTCSHRSSLHYGQKLGDQRSCNRSVLGLVHTYFALRRAICVVSPPHRLL